MLALRLTGWRTYIAEPRRGHQDWAGQRAERAAVYANRRRMAGGRGRALMRRRGELIERAFAHTLETGGMRRTHLRGHDNIAKRILVHVAGFNLGLLMRKAFGVGKPRCLQGRLAVAAAALATLMATVAALLSTRRREFGPHAPRGRLGWDARVATGPIRAMTAWIRIRLTALALSTGC
jgi:transposase